MPKKQTSATRNMKLILAYHAAMVVLLYLMVIVFDRPSGEEKMIYLFLPPFVAAPGVINTGLLAISSKVGKLNRRTARIIATSVPVLTCFTYLLISTKFTFVPVIWVLLGSHLAALVIGLQLAGDIDLSADGPAQSPSDY